MNRLPNATSDTVREAAQSLVSDLAAPGTLTARNYAQINVAETLCIRFRVYFTRVNPTAPELAAINIVAPIYRHRFPLT